MAASKEWQQADLRDRERYAWAGAAPAPSGSAGPSPSPSLPDDTHYAVLGLRPAATPAEVRRAYLRRVAAAHPDKGGDRAAFDRVQAAHAVLSDPTERLIYDEQLQRRLARGGSWHEGAGSSSGGGDGGGRSCHTRRGVTVVVHGQTQGSQPTQRQPRKQRRCGSAELQAVTAEIQRLQGGGSGSPDGTSAATADLAAAHLRRAELLRTSGQLHHALFDAEEALRLQPGSSQAATLVAELEAAVAAAEEPASTGGGSADGSDESDADPFL